MLEKSHTILRTWHPEDLPHLQALRNNFSLQQQLMTQPTMNSSQDVQNWLIRKSTTSDTRFFVIANKTTQQAVGYIQVVALSSTTHSGRLGICLAPESQGQGYGREAILLLEKYLIEKHKLRKLMLEVLSNNRRAISLYARLGYRKCGHLRQHFLCADKYQDVVLMEKILVP